MKQDFGYRATQFAGKEKGEVGGTIQRSNTPAAYAAPLAGEDAQGRADGVRQFRHHQGAGRLGRPNTPCAVEESQES